MVSSNAAPLLCKFYYNGCFPLAPVFLLFCDFFSVRFPGFVKKCNHFICMLLSIGQFIFLACEAGCKPDVFEGSSMLFSVNPFGSSSDVATHTCADPFVITLAVPVVCCYSFSSKRSSGKFPHVLELSIVIVNVWMRGLMRHNTG